MSTQFTNKEKLALLELKAQVDMGQRSHMYDGDAFYVSATELNRKFGDNYKRKLSNILDVVSDNYSFNVKKAYTMGYTFKKEAVREMACWTVEPTQKPKSGEEGKDYFREVVNIAKLEHFVLKGPSLFAKPEHYMAARMYVMSYNKEDGCNWVTYERTAGKEGRRFATSPSLQSLPKVLRAEIVYDQAEIDMSNCHPIIMDGLARKYGLDLQKLSLLAGNRPLFIDEIKENFECHNDGAKKLLLQTCYLAPFKYKQESSNAFTKWIKENTTFTSPAWKNGDGYTPHVTQNLEGLHKDLSILAFELKSKDESKPFAHIEYASRRLALTIQAIEDECLQLLERKCRTFGLEIQALSFDGFLITDWRAFTDDIKKYLEDSLEVFLKARYNIDARIPLAIKKYK
jgi:hypothetical protein